MERGRKNRVKSKFNMESPFRQDVTTSNTDWEGRLTRDEYDKFKQMTSGYTPPTTELTDPVEPVEEKGIDRWIDKPIMEVLGLTKEQREARKARKAQRIEDAKKAESEGTETLKQAKLVKRAKKREDRLAKRAIKDKQKLAKWRKKNPVTGKEAINKLAMETGGTPIAKYKKGYGV